MLLKKVWDVDALKCPKCGGQMKVISFIEQPRILFQGECVPSYRILSAYLSATMFDRGFPGFPGNHYLRDMLVSPAVWPVSGRNQRHIWMDRLFRVMLPRRWKIKFPYVNQYENHRITALRASMRLSCVDQVKPSGHHSSQ